MYFGSNTLFVQDDYIYLFFVELKIFQTKESALVLKYFF